MKKWRKMTWVIWVWCALIIAWAVLGAGSANCGDQTDQLSNDACTAGAGIGVLVVLLIGFFGFTFLSLIWFMTRPKVKPCPRCGEDVRKGTMVCSHCQHDFTGGGAAAT